jgi:hypothetical protein
LVKPKRERGFLRNKPGTAVQYYPAISLRATV